MPTVSRRSPARRAAAWVSADDVETGLQPPSLYPRALLLQAIEDVAIPTPYLVIAEAKPLTEVSPGHAGPLERTQDFLTQQRTKLLYRLQRIDGGIGVSKSDRRPEGTTEERDGRRRAHPLRELLNQHVLEHWGLSMAGVDGFPPRSVRLPHPDSYTPDHPPERRDRIARHDADAPASCGRPSHGIAATRCGPMDQYVTTVPALAALFTRHPSGSMAVIAHADHAEVTVIGLPVMSRC